MKQKEKTAPKPKSDPLLITEFIVEVYENEIRWGGLDRFLWWMLHHRPGEKFAPTMINRFGNVQPSKRTGRRA